MKRILLRKKYRGQKPWVINYIDTKDKCRHLKKLTCKGTLRHKEGRRKGKEGRKGGSGEGMDKGKEECGGSGFIRNMVIW